MPEFSSINIALGAGAARGLAHIGVLKSLQRHGIPIAGIAGSSMGAVVGAAFASGAFEPFTMAALSVRRVDLLRLADLSFSAGGLLQGERVRTKLEGLIGNPKFEDLEIPLAIVTTDVQLSETVVLTHGSVIDAIRASISVPGLFAPVRADGRLLVDGGLTNPVPANVVRTFSGRYTVAVEIGSDRDVWTRAGTYARVRMNRLRNFVSEIPYPRALTMGEVLQILNRMASTRRRGSGYGLFRMLLVSLEILETELGAHSRSLQKADYIVRPHVGHIDGHRFDLARQAIEAGEKAGEELVSVLNGLRQPADHLHRFAVVSTPPPGN
ncbi:hypothetical protein DNHGIG_34390 [Collibacillus ludicampi]|uniref:PNPLA domain-containing protein n=1 Tax=Collibacillus ludicampi TaxID=2771369 RepID=A0AAV4LJC4_9BACL|nr:patatin-like phospholipase family protein [Collibacillus ludicampi]GIM47890.1 hypothetical protein DNHGIG_34390 [Collibacillus ludicampi]